MTAGTSPFVWDGKDSSGMQWPDGNYTITVTAQDASGQLVAIPTEIEAVVDSADLTQNPPTLSIGGQDYTLDKIKRVVRNGA
jgi:flagellar basal-body rod modification protein FlgD